MSKSVAKPAAKKPVIKPIIIHLPKQPIESLSYKPEKIKALLESGGAIIDIVTSGNNSKEIISWAEHFRKQKWPVFAEQCHNSKVKLWVQQTAF